MKLQLHGYYLQNLRVDRSTFNTNEDLFAKLNEVDEDEYSEESIMKDICQLNIGLVAYIIKRRYSDIKSVCENLRVTYDDFYSCGIYGLWKAVLTFRLEKGYKFATYAARLIHNEIGMFIRDHKKRAYDRSLQETVTTRGDNDREVCLQDALSDTVSYEDTIVDSTIMSIVMEEIQRKLSTRDLIIFHDYILGDLSQVELAEKLNISQSYISRLVKLINKKAKKIYNMYMVS